MPPGREHPHADEPAQQCVGQCERDPLGLSRPEQGGGDEAVVPRLPRVVLQRQVQGRRRPAEVGLAEFRGRGGVVRRQPPSGCGSDQEAVIGDAPARRGRSCPGPPSAGSRRRAGRRPRPAAGGRRLGRGGRVRQQQAEPNQPVDGPGGGAGGMSAAGQQLDETLGQDIPAPLPGAAKPASLGIPRRAEGRSRAARSTAASGCGG